MAAGRVYLALNLDPTKPAVHIDKNRYRQRRGAILDNLREHGPLTCGQLGTLVEEQLADDFDGSVTWYFAAVKLDLEARGEIRRVLKSLPRMIELGSA